MKWVDTCPMWLQVLVVTPHAFLLVALVIWNPTTRKGDNWDYGLFAYLLLVYFLLGHKV